MSLCLLCLDLVLGLQCQVSLARYALLFDLVLRLSKQRIDCYADFWEENWCIPYAQSILCIPDGFGRHMDRTLITDHTLRLAHPLDGKVQ